MIKVLKALAWVILLLGCGGLAASYAGAIHPIGDSFAVFRIPLAVIGLLGVLAVIRPFWVALIVAAIMALGIGVHLRSYTPHMDRIKEPLVIYQKNLWRFAAEQDRFINDVHKREPDVLTLQEIDGPNASVAGRLRGTYPYQHLCNPMASNSTAVISRIPFIPDSLRCGNGFAAAQINADGRVFWIVSLHLEWPWPFAQAEQISQILPDLHALQGAKIIAGDFNSVAWSHALRRIEAATDTKRVGQYLNTYVLGRLGYQLGIDHILASDPISVKLRTRPQFGSDHLGLLAGL